MSARGIETHGGHVSINGRSLDDALKIIMGLNMEGGSLKVISKHVCDLGAETEEAFNGEPETLVLGDKLLDAQSSPIMIEGEISALTGGAWPDTAYLEIGVRPEATKNERNSGIYMIVFSLNEDDYRVNLQDYTASREQEFTFEKTLAPFSYRIKLHPNNITKIGGTADLVLLDKDGEEIGKSTDVPYGYSSTWEEGKPGLKNEDFSRAHVFYSLIADRRGIAGKTYTATVSNLMTNIIPKAIWNYYK